METLRVPAVLDSLSEVSTFITAATSQVGLGDHAAWEVQLAVDEATTNIIQHGYGTTPGNIEIRWWTADGDMVVELRDWGITFDPDAVPTPNIASSLEERETGGLGIYLMSKLMDLVSYTFNTQNGNVLTLVKHITLPTVPASVFALEGRLDAMNSERLLSRVKAAVSAGERRVLLDMSAVPFLSSSGLRALLLLNRELSGKQGELRLASLQQQVYEVFVLTGFTQVFAIHRTRDEAMAAFAQGSE